jgi:hypothetical protein
MDQAEEFHTPYTYVGRDPVNLVDPDGRQEGIIRYTALKMVCTNLHIAIVKIKSKRWRAPFYFIVKSSSVIYRTALSNLGRLYSKVAFGASHTGTSVAPAPRNGVDLV